MEELGPWGHKESGTTDRLHFFTPILQTDSLPSELPGKTLFTTKLYDEIQFSSVQSLSPV